jgi:hypothetical protein
MSTQTWVYIDGRDHTLEDLDAVWYVMAAPNKSDCREPAESMFLFNRLRAPFDQAHSKSMNAREAKHVEWVGVRDGQQGDCGVVRRLGPRSRAHQQDCSTFEVARTETGLPRACQ